MSPHTNSPLSDVRSLATYAVHLANGHTIKAKSIKGDTIKQYLIAASGLIQMFDKVERDARKQIGATHLCLAVTKVINEVKRFEEMPRRREPYCTAMHRRLVEKSKFYHADSSDGCWQNWFGVGLQAGNRGYEWCQAIGKGQIGQEELNPKGEKMASTCDDITFMGKGKRRMSWDTALDNTESVMYVKVRYRWQKNKEHGFCKTQSRNEERTWLCSVRNWIAICKRFVRLRGNACNDQPLSIYYDTATSTVRNLTSDMAKTTMRILAQEVFDITDEKELSLFTCHSLRVGACCILFATGYPAEFIQRVLRWKSDSWRTYVRDLVAVAHKHNIAMSQSSDLPNL